MSESIGPTEDDLRQRAIKRVKAKRDLKGHLLIYVCVNVLLIGIWYITGAGFFWPLFVLFGWGIGVVMNIWDVYTPETTEEKIAKEMDRLRS
jgi:hypothetical protein